MEVSNEYMDLMYVKFEHEQEYMAEEIERLYKEAMEAADLCDAAIKEMHDDLNKDLCNIHDSVSVFKLKCTISEQEMIEIANLAEYESPEDIAKIYKLKINDVLLIINAYR